MSCGSESRLGRGTARGEAPDAVVFQVDGGRSPGYEFSHHVADAGARLEAMTAESEGVVEASHPLARANDWQVVGEVAFDPAPSPQDVDIRQGRRDAPQVRQLLQREVGPGLRTA